MAGALAGVRVIDFGQYIAGPLTAMLLADHGADVVRVDPPGGPRWDTPANATWNRGKRSIVLNLKSRDGRDMAHRLVATADVVVENFRPGVMDRLGAGPSEMCAANPRLIYCSLPGFAADDERHAVAAWEGVVAAATGTYRAGRTGRPVYTAVPISSSYAAFQAAVAIVMALNARERDGRGQRIEVPLFDATFAAIGNRGLRIHDRQASPAEGDAAPAGIGWTRQFLCKDGRWFMYHSGNQNAAAFFAATGAAEWIAAVRDGRMTAEDLTNRAEALFRSRTAAEWEAFCAEVGTEGAVCRTASEWLSDPQAIASQIVVETSDPVLGVFKEPGINVRLSETPGAIRWPRPLPDADRDPIAAELPRRAHPAPADGAAPLLQSALEGVKVLDLCIVLAGPTCGRTMAEYGADVIKIDGPHRAGVSFHNDINRAKRSIVIDLKTADGLELFWRLVDGADVVVQNFRKGVADKLGIGYEEVRARKPDIVYASLNTYGQIGPYAGRPGHEQIAQAATGMQERYGGDARPTLAPFAVNDYGTGFMGAFGVAMALLHRQRTGQGQHVDTALAYTATMLQSALVQEYAGSAHTEPRGQDALGSGPLNRAYEAADGWLFLSCRPEDLEQAPDLADLAGLSGVNLERGLEFRLSSRSVEAWTAILTGAGIGAHRVVNDITELMDDPWVRAHELSVTREHEGFGPITTTGPAPRLWRTPVIVGRPAPRPGSDAASILAEIGMAGDLERLVRDRVVVTEGITAR